MTLNKKLVELAAANNAKWCSIVCQANGAPSIFREHAWFSSCMVPMYYPNIVTLKASCKSHLVESLTQMILGKASIKDSFDSLQLPESNYQKLFEAKWFVASPTPSSRAPYFTIKTMLDLNKWEIAMSNSSVAGIFNYKVLSHPAVRFIAIKIGEEIVSGCVITKSKGVVGITNFFSNTSGNAENWSICLSAARVFAGIMPVVGYTRNNNLSYGALPTSIVELGALSVWLRKELVS
ncbi:hypothetical protein L0663_01725 [Dyadobacter sp. CY107]|uniref:hypothetical protein n=1 Tax=Dyadobacter fanqingshengii TaxID=2906443 RepID=UPI001F251627|nr:hypothetical protein [Dyadobacter fanqingshengii]MCF2502084.1 hypothetical protein [Dyadobacter fanqingshengii]